MAAKPEAAPPLHPLRLSMSLYLTLSPDGAVFPSSLMSSFSSSSPPYICLLSP